MLHLMTITKTAFYYTCILKTSCCSRKLDVNTEAIIGSAFLKAILNRLEVLDLHSDYLFVIKPSLSKTILPPPVLSRSFLQSENSYSSMLNWASENDVLVSSVHLTNELKFVYNYPLDCLRSLNL